MGHLVAPAVVEEARQVSVLGFNPKQDRCYGINQNGPSSA